MRGEQAAEGSAIVCCHGLTATRSYVLHGSSLLARRGFRIVSYDARGHGKSDPAAADEDYDYPGLTADLGRVIDSVSEDRPVLLAGHSMGAHTAAAFALADPERVAALVLIGPAYGGGQLSDAEAAYWDGLAEALRRRGPEGFAEAASDTGSNDRELLYRLALQRIKLHSHPEAVAEALEQVPRSQPFSSISDLERLDMPVLVVASHDEIDTGHPYAVAAAYADAIPGATLISEEPGQSPLAWQGGRLSREIASFAEHTGLFAS